MGKRGWAVRGEGWNRGDRGVWVGCVCVVVVVMVGEVCMGIIKSLVALKQSIEEGMLSK